MILVAGIAWGFSGVSGQYLMTHGINVNLLTSLRLIIAMIIATNSETIENYLLVLGWIIGW